MWISQEYHPAVCAVISGAEDVGVSSSQFDDFSVAATSTCKARELKISFEVFGAKTQAIFDNVSDTMVTAAQPIPGFRRIPKDILLEILGPSKVYKGVIKEVINSTIAEYVEKLKILKFKLEYTISAATLAALPDPLYSCEYNCKQYGEDAVKPRAELGLPSHLYLCIDCFIFHTYDYARHFVSACTCILGLEGTPEGVEDQGKLTRVAAFPIGIDSDRFIRALEAPQVQENIRELAERFKGRKKILAFEKFLEENPDWRDKVVLLQIAVPTRTDVPEYVALVTFLRDGMNLVSYEFVACQDAKKGVLILSEFVGAAQSLGPGAILVNPWNITEVALSIKQALNVPIDEREKRHKHNFAHVTSHTAQEWAETFGFNATLTEPVDTPGSGGDQIKEMELKVHPGLKEPLKVLCSDPKTTIVVLSGNDRSVLDDHGMLTKGEWMTTMLEHLNMEWVDSVKHVLEYFTERTPRSHFEPRDTSLVWNYKYADVEFGRLQARDMLQHLWTGPISNASIDVVQGGRSVEVRAVGVTKGAAIDRIL
ncbi:alpha,alpha-trehalose-phosphate synthase [UDP-forming] 1-like [Fagus crenata]